MYNARSHSSSSESRQTFLQQVTANQDRLAKLEQVQRIYRCVYDCLRYELVFLQEKEQLALDLQLLKVKYEKEQKVSAQVMCTFVFAILELLLSLDLHVLCTESGVTGECSGSRRGCLHTHQHSST